MAVSAFCLLLAFGLLWTARNVHGFADFYVRSIYPLWVGSLGRFWGIFPFSVVEFLIYGMILFLVSAVFWGIVRVIKRKQSFAGALTAGGLFVAVTVSVLFLIYVLNCGINYSAGTFSETYGLERSGYTSEELSQVCQWLTREVTGLSGLVIRDEDGALTKKSGWNREASVTMKKLGETYDMLYMDYPVPKGVAVSEILSWQQLSGVYSPFTVEANYNADMPAYNIPFTMCHELSHLSGYMHEDEANFIAWLACMRSDDPDFNYSGALMGWIYCTNELYKEDPETYLLLCEQLPDEVRRELHANSEFWDSYKGPVTEVSQNINDAYLKAHKQSEGVKTYDRMVDLLVDYYLKEGK